MEFIKNNLGYIIGFFTIPIIKLLIKRFNKINQKGDEEKRKN